MKKKNKEKFLAILENIWNIFWLFFRISLLFGFYTKNWLFLKIDLVILFILGSIYAFIFLEDN